MDNAHVWKNKIPYLCKIYFPAQMTHADTGNFPDIFTEEYEEICKLKAIDMCTLKKNDPYLIGYYLTDCIEWPVFGRVSKRLDSNNWLDAIKRLGPGSTGKQEYVKLMKKRYESIDSFNRVYTTAFIDFDALLIDKEFSYSVPCDIEAALEDDKAFLSLLAERFYSVTCSAIRSVDKNHMILGDLFDGNRPIQKEVLEASVKWTDILSIQYYGYFKDQFNHLKYLYEKYNKPILLADSCYAVVGDQMPRPCGVRVSSQEQRAIDFERYANQILQVNFILGWFWCGYKDSPIKYEPRRQHTGVKDFNGNYHEPLCSAMRKVFGNIYDRI
jgi:agarase